MLRRSSRGRARAAIDIGTNSVRLLVAIIQEGEVIPFRRELTSTRLGEGLEPGGNLLPQPQQRTLQALARFREALAAGGVDEAVAVATSAVREAANGKEFAALAQDVLQFPVRVIDGHEEARLGYLGAVRALGLGEAVVVDIGGGSTELSYPHGGELISCSCPVGAVRCSGTGDGRETIEVTLKPATAPVPAGLPLVGVGGTVTTLVAVHKKLRVYDPAQVHGVYLTGSNVDRISAELAALDLERRRQVPGLQPERADIILAGTAILQVILSQLNCDGLTASEADLLEGLILSMDL